MLPLQIGCPSIDGWNSTCVIGLVEMVGVTGNMLSSGLEMSD